MADKCLQGSSHAVKTDAYGDQCAVEQSTHVMGACELQQGQTKASPHLLIHFHDFVCSIFEIHLGFIVGNTIAVLQTTPDLVNMIAAV